MTYVKNMWTNLPSYCNCVKEEVPLSSFEILLKQIIFLPNNPSRSVWGSTSANISSYVFYASEKNKHMMLLCVLVKRNVVMFLSHIDSALRLYCHYKSSFLWASELNSSPPILGVNSILLGWTRRSKDLHPSNGGGLVICTKKLVSKKVKWLLLNLSTMLSIPSHRSLDIYERERDEIVFIFSVFWVLWFHCSSLLGSNFQMGHFYCQCCWLLQATWKALIPSAIRYEETSPENPLYLFLCCEVLKSLRNIWCC